MILTTSNFPNSHAWVGISVSERSHKYVLDYVLLNVYQFKLLIIKKDPWSIGVRINAGNLAQKEHHISKRISMS